MVGGKATTASQPIVGCLPMAFIDRLNRVLDEMALRRFETDVSDRCYIVYYDGPTERHVEKICGITGPEEAKKEWLQRTAKKFDCPVARLYLRLGAQNLDEIMGKLHIEPVFRPFNPTDIAMMRHPITRTKLADYLKNSPYDVEILMSDRIADEEAVLTYLQQHAREEGDDRPLLVFAKSSSTGDPLTPFMILHTMGHAVWGG